MDPTNQAYSLSNEGRSIPLHSLSNTNHQTQPYRAQEQAADQQAPTHIPHPHHQSNMRLAHETYAGMTFCPGIPDIPVARFLPPRGDVCNFMAPQYNNASVTHERNCVRCGIPKAIHEGGSAASWTECTNTCFFHNKYLNDTLFCPLLYASVDKMNRVYNWPIHIPLPSYFRIFPTEEQQKHLRDSGYMWNRDTQMEAMPTFTQKAWDLEGELGNLGKWALGQRDYDHAVMSSLGAQLGFPGLPLQAKMAPAIDQPLGFSANNGPYVQMIPGQPLQPQPTLATTFAADRQPYTQINLGQPVQPASSLGDWSILYPALPKASEILRDAERRFHTLIIREQDGFTDTIDSLQDEIRDMEEEAFRKNSKVKELEEKVLLYENTFRRHGLSLPSGRLPLIDETLRSPTLDSHVAIPEAHDVLDRFRQSGYSSSGKINNILATAEHLRGDSTAENPSSGFHTGAGQLDNSNLPNQRQP